MVADALSCKAMTDLRVMFTRFNLFDDGSLLVELQVKPVRMEQIKGKQLEDESLGLRFCQIENGSTVDFGLNNEGVLCFRGKICVPKDIDLRQSILRERRIVAPMLCTLVEIRYTDIFVRYIGGWVLGVKILMWKWEKVTIDFVSGLPLTPSKKDLIWVIVDRCRTLSCWTELGERRILGPELVSDTEDKVRLIQDRLKAASDRQKSYADLKRPVAYQLELLPELEWIHDVFHVFILRCYHSNPSHIVPVEEIEVKPDMTFEEELVQILD
ncbi:uncharacterized protein [Gossypium hirsutum]|uniref:Uncharacterized protein n=1 Tax=Gossypium hirsutum TaxID=3635 RepID=A0ABM2ZJT2_GOSHI|nr:uncharacterized protein LOC121213817 [Gossypium hirsutum]